VHARGSFIFVQLWALGRVADPTILKQEGGFDVVGASPIPLTSNKDSVTPRALSVAEIKEYVQLYAKAARNAIEAGFDGVEIHGANGYLLDQFLQSETNKRTDEYGGSIQNRIRFPLEVVDAVVKAVGAERTGVRISPWSEFQGEKYPAPCIPGYRLTFFGNLDMGMKDPLPTFSAFVERIRDTHTSIGHIHVIEDLQRTTGTNFDDENDTHSNEPLRKIWGNRPYIAAGGFDRASANRTIEKHGGLIAFGRHFISNVCTFFISS
jgi:NADPH2 dehydrogenase